VSNHNSETRVRESRPIPGIAEPGLHSGGVLSQNCPETLNPKSVLAAAFAASGADVSTDAQFIANMSAKLCGMPFQNEIAAAFVGEYQLAGSL
jgi:hypothetical protein